MKTLPLYALALAIGCAPTLATTPPASSKPAQPSDRAAMRHEMADLQKRMNELGRRMGELSARLDMDSPRASFYRFVGNPDRGMLGVVLRPGDQGLQVAALTPGGPAERAGMRAGDVIDQVNGKPVRQAGAPSDSGGLDDLKAGTTVKLDLLRDGKRRSVTVKAERHVAPSWYSVALAPDAGAQRVELRRLKKLTRDAGARAMANIHRYDAHMDKHGMPSERIFLRQLAPWWGLNLASLNPQLGSYFGADQGALVLSSQAKRYPGLQAGDVITAVDGTPVQRPEDVMRALRGKSEGATTHLAVRRHNKTISVRMKAPELDLLMPPPPPPAPPAPPAPTPPTPPAPPAPVGDPTGAL